MGIKTKKNLGERVYVISERLKIPRITVERVIKEYLNGLVESALNQEDIVIDNIMSIKLLQRGDTGEIIARGRVSPSLRSKLSAESSFVETVNS